MADVHGAGAAGGRPIGATTNIVDVSPAKDTRAGYFSGSNLGLVRGATFRELLTDFLGVHRAKCENPEQHACI